MQEELEAKRIRRILKRILKQFFKRETYNI